MQQRWPVVRDTIVSVVLSADLVKEFCRSTQLACAFDPQCPPCVVTEGERQVVRLFLVVLIRVETSFAIEVEYKRCPSVAFRRRSADKLIDVLA